MKKGAKSFKNPNVAWIISGTVILVVLLIMFTIFQLNPSQTVSVNGQSQLEVTPDIVSVNFNIQTSAQTASEAQSNNSEIYDDFVSSLMALGIEESEIKTVGLSVHREYDWINGERTEKGYIAQHQVKVELPTNETSKLSGIIDAGVDAGALIDYINFELSDSLEEEKKSEAVQKATENARLKAEAIADGLDGKLRGIVSVRDSNVEYYPSPLYAREDSVVSSEAAGEDAKASVQGITPGDQNVYASVRVIYKIR